MLRARQHDGPQDADLRGRVDRRGCAKAEKSDVWIYRRETPTDAPAIYVTDASLANGRKIVDTSAEADAYLWSSGAQLIDYTNDEGRRRLQASLYLPANYEKGKQYPMIVYIYERLTQGHYQYGRPTANGFSRQAYTSNGYAVLQPDIKYYVNDPGMSAVWALVPAVQAAVEDRRRRSRSASACTATRGAATRRRSRSRRPTSSRRRSPARR